ncbi:hypothetical protein EDD63_1113 [Breznakia blatticola]|uniref:Uncharacterized protein n=1 Tax=Breznakia blatticola TaxID=1754012 RepID=A0A4R7ZUF4_9FIRM|nr:hypothetical protein [Breznakia blatticola]TDW20591.1 hypothetical protein EDD63_1113 [Breznakia blatticola]
MIKIKLKNSAVSAVSRAIAKKNQRQPLAVGIASVNYATDPQSLNKAL